MTTIFDRQDRGGVERIRTNGRTAYITMWADAGNALGNVLMSTAPADQIRIEEGVDFTLSKALSGDFLIATFGHKPVTITISGFDIYNDPCLKTQVPTVQGFYDRWNVHVNKAARINLGMAGSSGAGTAYRCVLVSLRRDTAQDMGIDGVGKYTITLLGALMTK